MPSSKRKSPSPGAGPICRNDSPRCKILKALVEEQSDLVLASPPQSSLEILNPPTENRKIDPAPESSEPALGQELIDMSIICVEDINNRTTRTETTIPDFIDSSFKGVLSDQSDATNYHDFLEVQRGIANIDSGYQINVDPAFANIDERTGHACVYMLVEILGRPVGIRRDAVILWKWRKRYGRWLLYKQIGMRGMDCATDHGQEEGSKEVDAKSVL